MERAFHIINRFYAGIEILDEEGEADTDYQPDDDAQSDVQRLVRLHGTSSGFGRVHDLHHHGLGQGDVNLLAGNLHVKDLAEMQHFIQIPLGIEVRPALGGRQDVIGLGPSNLGFQIIETPFHRSYLGVQGLQHPIHPVRDFVAQIVHAGFAFEDLRVLRPVLLLHRYQSLISRYPLLEQCAEQGVASCCGDDLGQTLEARLLLHLP